MDPLSITASTITILELTTELIKGTRNYYKSARSAPKEVAELIDELTTFNVVLQRLKFTSERAKAAASQQTTGVVLSQPNHVSLPMLEKMLAKGGPLTLCFEEMLAFKVKLTKDQSKLKRSIRWPFQKEEIQVVVQRLRNLKSILDTAISTDQL